MNEGRGLGEEVEGLDKMRDRGLEFSSEEGGGEGGEKAEGSRGGTRGD
jgi:hypothetical protein